MIAAEGRAAGGRRTGTVDRWARAALENRLRRLEHGRVTLSDAGELEHFGSEGAALQATLTVLDPHFYRALLFSGVLGAAESYIDGHWRCDDLVALTRILALDYENFGLETGRSRVWQPWNRLFHALRSNTRSGSRRNIEAHYDLGNEFFELFLDPTLTYSCGVFERPDMTMEEASIAKIDRACRKLRLSKDDHLLEIGTGWGSFALHAAATYGCRVTTTTISREQHELASERVSRAGLSDRVALLFEDYRELRGSFDKLVSIEMIEAVGPRHLTGFFRVCSERLKSNGAMLLQAITHGERAHERSIKSVDFIKRYVFPGGQLVSLGAISASLSRATDLRITHLEDITPHYAETLAHWRQKMFENLERMRALGLPQSFLNLWDFYLAYCQGGFRERAIGVAQILLEKPHSRGEPPQDAPA